MSERRTLLSRVRAGDIVQGATPDGSNQLMFVEQVDQGEILVRQIMSQTQVRFDRPTGRSIWCEGGGDYRIVSIAPLPPGEHQIIVGLDRKMRLGKFAGGLDPAEYYRLDKAEQITLIAIEDYYRHRPLPD